MNFAHFKIKAYLDDNLEKMAANENKTNKNSKNESGSGEKEEKFEEKFDYE
jgi:hypothetical protein